MVDTARTTAALIALFPDNTSGDISAQDGRDFITSYGSGCVDVAAGRVPTFSSTPNASYPGTVILNGISQVALLTAPDELHNVTALFHARSTTGWRAADISGSTLTATIDFGASKEAEVVQAIVSGTVQTADQIYHPSAVKVEWSDDNSAYTTFATALSSLDDDALATSIWVCVFNAAPIEARYWRLSVDEPSPGSGDNWIMLRRLKLYGRVI